MLKVDIKGVGWVTPSGIGNGCLGEAFKLGGGVLPTLKSRMFLDVTHPRFGRFDSYAKAGFGAIALALRDACLYQWTHKRAIGLVVSTRCGCQEADLAYFATAASDGGALASPNLFAYTLPGTMLGEASIQFGLTGPSFVVDDSLGHLAGVHAALDLMQWGFCETVVAGWCDVDSRIVRTGSEGPSGAVFFVMARGGEGLPPAAQRPFGPRAEFRMGEGPPSQTDAMGTPDPESAFWQWDGRDLLRGGQRATDLVGLAHQVLVNNRGRISGSEQ